MNEDEQPATATPFSGVVAMFRKSLDLGLSKLNKKTKMLGGWGTLKPMKQADLKKKSATNYKKGFKQTKGIKVKGQKEGERNIFHRAAPHPHPQRPHSLLPLPSLADGSTNKKAGSTPVSKGTLSRTRTRTRARARERAHAHAHARRICSSILGWPSSSGRKHSTCTRTNAQLAPPNHTPLASTACAHIQYTATPTQIPRVPARRPRRARQLLRATLHPNRAPSQRQALANHRLHRKVVVGSMTWSMNRSTCGTHSTGGRRGVPGQGRCF